jgi:GMP synthase (glutamine-hydrolysing)
MNHPVLILDFGSQFTQLIARRVRELGTFSLIQPFSTPLDAIRALEPSALILSGGPQSVYGAQAPKVGREVLELGLPTLGICYGMQLVSFLLDGKVVPSNEREYGKAMVTVDPDHPLFAGTPREQKVWMSHGDKVGEAPPGFQGLASTDNTPLAAFADDKRRIYGVQFHPEVHHTDYGTTILKNFLQLAKARENWSLSSYKDHLIRDIRQKAGKARVIAGLSGGVDSTVAASLVAEAIGKNLTCILVDTGLLRKNEADEVMGFFTKYHLDVRKVDAGPEFFARLKGVEDPQEKRKIIGHLFYEVFEREAKALGNAEFLMQGTLYPDVIESVPVYGPSSTIKLHHNVGGLPEKMNLKIIEPLRELFKDEVRRLGTELGIPRTIIGRHPFPGPGMAVRILGAVDPESVRVLQDADAIFLEELRAAGLYDEISQAFAVLLPVKSVGVMGDERTYENACVLRAVVTTDFMTADFARIPHDVLGRTAARIVNEVKGINRVAYDVTTKPPATIEWE